MRDISSISIFFPCYNDYRSIGKLVKDAFDTLKQVARKHEVIVVDDYSTDGTRLLLQNYTKKYKNLKVIFHEKNLGYGSALITGFKAAKYNLIFYTDGDGQYDVRELPIMLGLMTKDVNFVNGMKITRRDPTYRVFVGNLYSFLVRWLFWIPIHDIDCDFRLIRKSLIKKLTLKSHSGAICIELVKKSQLAGGKFRQVSIHHYERKFGNSQFFRPKRILSTFFELSKLWIELIAKKGRF